MKLDKKAAFRGRVFEEDSFMWKEKDVETEKQSMFGKNAFVYKGVS